MAEVCGIEEQPLPNRMIEETLHHRGTTLVRRLILAPGEATRWHRNPFDCVVVVLKGTTLSVEFRDGAPSVQVIVTPGQVDWYEPNERAHRAVNVGASPYEDVTTFFLAEPDDIPQPDAE
jgi:quercetin dioxygenase-like cupin family protein